VRAFNYHKWVDGSHNREMFSQHKKKKRAKYLYLNVFETTVKNLVLGKIGHAVCGVQLSLNAACDLRIGNLRLSDKT
jgi:hypothetical protein